MIADPRKEAEPEICIDCGAELCRAQDRAFFLEPRGVLCGECAIRRGGRYDVERDVWDVVPADRDRDGDLH